jgi:hypothetical protein
MIIWINGAFGATPPATSRRDFCLGNAGRGVAAAARVPPGTLLLLRSDKLTPAELADEVLSRLPDPSG